MTTQMTEDLEKTCAAELQAVNEFMASICEPGTSRALPGEMLINQKNWDALIARMKELGFYLGSFDFPHLQLAYDSGKACALFTLQPQPVPAAPQVIEVQVPITPADRRNTRDRLLDAGVVPTAKKYSSENVKYERASGDAAARALAEITQQTKFATNSERFEPLPLDVTDEWLNVNRKNITAEQLRDLGRRRSAARFKK
jgi:hypothetical protein